MGRYAEALSSGLTVGVRAFLDYSYVDVKQQSVPKLITPEERLLQERRQILREEWSGLDYIRTDERIKTEVEADLEQERLYRDPNETYHTAPWEYRRFIPDQFRRFAAAVRDTNPRITFVDDKAVSEHFGEAVLMGVPVNHPFRTPSEINAMRAILPLARFGEFISDFTSPDILGREKQIVRADVLTVPLYQP